VGAASSLVVELPDEAATAGLAARLAGRVRRGDVIGLSGALGCGKTSFARAFIRAYGSGAEEVPSPTFTLVEIYSFPDRPAIWHFDLYRLTAPEQAWELGIEEAWSDGISLVEWPERLGRLLPAEHLLLALADGAGPSARLARLAATAGWAGRLDGLADG
jgi:tRNA threonylcarbamoyladenosine biosynthesis protein TsaE